MCSIVYKLTFPNNKIYIGTTSRPLNVRLEKGYPKNVELNKTLKMYRKDVKTEILYTSESADDCFEKEIHYIALYNARDKNIGFNIALGGKGCKGVKMSEKAKKLLLERLKNNKYHLGKKHTEETKRKISEMQKGKHRSERTEFPKRKVLCVELNLIFESLADVERQLNVNHSHISQVCSNQRKTSGGYHWKYIEE